MTILYFIPLIVLEIISWWFAYSQYKEGDYSFLAVLSLIHYMLLIAITILCLTIGLSKIASAQTQLSATVKPNACNQCLEVCNKLK